MAGMIRDNGLVNPLNRGTFYGCRDGKSGRLEGIALIGHATLLETRTDRALEVFAGIARRAAKTHVLLGEQERIDKFWNSNSKDGKEARFQYRELLFELSSSTEAHEPLEGLRQARADELDSVALMQAQMAFEENGINPLETDPHGFRQRCARRIKQGRSWVWIENKKLIFKAEIQCETPEYAYLEGVWLTPKERGKGYGQRCLAQICRRLITPHRSVCLLVNEHNNEAADFYKKAGFTVKAMYETIFLHSKKA